MTRRWVRTRTLVVVAAVFAVLLTAVWSVTWWRHTAETDARIDGDVISACAAKVAEAGGLAEGLHIRFQGTAGGSVRSWVYGATLAGSPVYCGVTSYRGGGWISDVSLHHE